MTDTGQRTDTSTVSVSTAPASRPRRPWRFTAVFTLIGLMCLAFAVASITVGRNDVAVIELLAGLAFVLAAVVGRLIRNRQAARARADD